MYVLCAAQALSRPSAWISAKLTHRMNLQQLSSGIFTIIFSTDMVDRLKNCCLHLSTRMSPL